MSLPLHIKVYFFRMLEGGIEMPEFEQWVYASKELETALQPDDYLELIAFPYKQADADYELRKLLNGHIHQGEFETYKLRALLQEALGNNERTLELVATCYDLYCHGYHFLYELGMQYGLAIAFDESFAMSRPEQRALLDQWWPGLETELRRALHWLDTGLIVLTGEQSSPGQYAYEDYRTEAEKNNGDRL